MLPKLPNRDRIRKAITLKFSGINRNPAAPDGSIFQTRNMCADRAPLLSPRPARWRLGQYDKCRGIFAHNGLFLVDNKTIYKDGEIIGTASTSAQKRFALFNDAVTEQDYLIMFPDQQMINVTPDEQDMPPEEPNWKTGLYIQDLNVHFVKDPDVNYSIIELKDSTSTWAEYGIEPGDTIEINGIPKAGAYLNNKTATVMNAWSNKLLFEPGTFEIALDQTIGIFKERDGAVKIEHVKCDLVNMYDTEYGQDACVLQMQPKINDRLTFSQMGIQAGDSVKLPISATNSVERSVKVLKVRDNELLFPYLAFADSTGRTLRITKEIQEREEPTTNMYVSFFDVPAVFEDGTLYGETAEANTIKRTDGTWTGLKPGDAVTISNSDEEGNNKTIIIREIEENKLRFYENSFENTPLEGGEPEETETITVRKIVPELDGIFIHEQRLWGYKGSKIFASKWNDPTNFSVFDGLESDSWTWNMDGAGDIQGAIVYQGYPTFFKEDKVIRIYGDRPTQYRAMDVTTMGIHPGCGNSLAIAGDTLYYVSRNGLTSFSGGYGNNIHAPFGELHFTEAQAASDGRRYYLSAFDGESWSMYVYDTVWGTWYREDESHAEHFAWDRGNLYMLLQTRDKKHRTLWLDGHATRVPSGAAEEGTIYSEVEFGDFTGNYWALGNSGGNPSRKGTSKIQLRVTLNGGALTVWIAYDGGERIKVAQITEQGKRSHCLPITPRRSDHYKVYLEGAGDWTLDSMVREEYSGSDIH